MNKVASPIAELVELELGLRTYDAELGGYVRSTCSVVLEWVFDGLDAIAQLVARRARRRRGA